MQGKLYGIGIGPGDHRLLTVRAVECLKKIDILIVPTSKKGKLSVAAQIAEPFIPSDLEIKPYHFPMIKDKKLKEEKWNEVTTDIEKFVNSGKIVGFITLGDSNTYSTFSYILDRLSKDIPVEIIPGITSFSQIASLICKPLAIDEEGYCVVPATMPVQQIKNSIELFDNIIVMKIKNHINKILPILTELDLINNSVIVSNVSMPEEKVYYGDEILRANKELSYFSTLVISKKR